MDWRDKRSVNRPVGIQAGHSRRWCSVERLKRACDEELSVGLRLDVFDSWEERGRFGSGGPLHPVANIEGAVDRAIWIDSDNSACWSIAKSREVARKDNASIGLNVGVLDW
jgi:hypothetical protein